MPGVEGSMRVAILLLGSIGIHNLRKLVGAKVVIALFLVACVGFGMLVTYLILMGLRMREIQQGKRALV